MHPVMQNLIKEKWNTFGRLGAIIAASIHFVYIMIWTMLAIFIPRDGTYYDGTEAYWRIPVELMGVLLTLYFILTVSIYSLNHKFLYIILFILCIYIYLYLLFKILD